MKTIISFMLICASCGIVGAQTPQYMLTTWTGGGHNSWKFNQNETKIQSLYRATEFPGMPRGTVTNVYLRIAPAGTLANINYHNVKLSIGYTADSAFENIGGRYYFAGGLTVLRSAAIYSFSGVTTLGNWIKFPAGGNWMFDPVKNFVVEISHGPEGGNNYNGFDWMASNATYPKSRAIAGIRDSIWTLTAANIFLDLGFDIQAAGLDDLVNVRNFGLFPNPSSDGRFVVSAESFKLISRASITVSNAVGQTVFQEEYRQPGASLFKEVDLHGLSAGVYFVKVVIDGERITRSINIQ